MNLKIGEEKSAKLPIWLKAIDFKCENMGIRVERAKGSICAYATDHRMKTIYCAMPLGLAKDLKDVSYVVKAQSKTRLLLSVGQVKFVIDYGAKKAATNLVGYRITHSTLWGEGCQIPWRAEYLPLFGLPMPPAQMDRQIAELFWKWFWENESAIVQLASGSRKESKLLHSQLQLWMGPMFLYVKVNDIDFKVSCHDNVNTFTLSCGGDAQLREDAEVFGDLMHERLKDHWNFIIEE